MQQVGRVEIRPRGALMYGLQTTEMRSKSDADFRNPCKVYNHIFPLSGNVRFVIMRYCGFEAWSNGFG